MSLSRKKVKTAPGQFSEAIRVLRERLGESQEGMARRLECTFAGYQSWELGRRNPGGKWLVKLLALCPDSSTRMLFGLGRTPPGPEPASQKAPSPKIIEADTGAARARELAHHAIEILFELAHEGSLAAREELWNFADRLNRRAGDLSRSHAREKN